MISSDKISKKAIWEALKEGLRVVLMALVSWAVAKLAVLPQTETVIIGTLVLRIADKFLYKYGKETKNDALIKGLTRF